MAENRREGREVGEESEEYGELLKFTFAGFVSGLAVGAVLDWFGLQKSGLGQWLVRTLSGEGESLFEGIYALRQRLRGAGASMAEAYGWGKLLGMVFPWVVDFCSRLFGVDVYGVEGFYIPWLYAMSDQIGANLAGLAYLGRREASWTKGAAAYARNPVMLTSAAVVLVAPLLVVVARMSGFIPDTQVLTAIETIGANLCWLPPVVGWWSVRQERRHVVR